MDYRRAWHAGGTYFFTLNLLQRLDNDVLIRHIDALSMRPAGHLFYLFLSLYLNVNAVLISLALSTG